MMARSRMLGIVFVAVLASAALVFAAGGQKFRAKLTAQQETGPAVTTSAEGIAFFKLSSDGKEMTYKVRVKNITDVTAAHIHEGKMGANGPVVAGLFAGPKKEGNFSGTLASGAITEKDLKGSLEGKSLEDLVKMIKDGDVYVNVHTDKYPEGELRGQIK